MVDELIPGDLRTFLLRYIDSIVQLEALLLLRANARDDWNVAKIAARLYTNETEVKAALDRLCEELFLTSEEGVYRYSCNDAAVRDLVECLADVYRKHLIPVTNIIHSKPRRIREFADAFKLRKDR